MQTINSTNLIIGVEFDDESFDRAIQSIERGRRQIDQLLAQRDAAPGVTGVAVAAMVAAGSTRPVSRRGLLGLGRFGRKPPA